MVSVLMTAHNREQHISEAIESVLSSTYQDFELIIVDDASTDNTPVIARQFEVADSRVRVYVNQYNLGQFGNRNKAASYAKGEYIKYFDSDDIMHYDMLEVMMNGMLQFPDAGIGASCDWQMLEQKKLPVQFSSRSTYINHYFEGCDILFIGPSGAIFKKSLFDAMGGFNESSGILADTLLSMQIAAITPVVAIKKDLFFWRLHDQQVTIGQQNHFAMIKERFRINETALANINCPFDDKEKELVRRNLKNIFI